MRWIYLALTVLSLETSAVTVGSGSSQSETRPLSSFDKIELRSLGTLTITQNTTPSLTVTADDNILGSISTSVDDGVLVLQPISGIEPKVPIEYYVSVQNLKEINMTGRAKAKSHGTLAVDQLSLKMRGATEADLVIQGEELDIDIDGGGQAVIVGEVDRQKVEIDGAGRYFGLSVATQRTDVTVNGTGKAQVYATHRLDVEINAGGKVIYRGNPKVTQKIRDNGSLIQTDR